MTIWNYIQLFVTDILLTYFYMLPVIFSHVQMPNDFGRMSDHATPRLWC